MKEKLAPESPLEYMMSAVFGIEVTDAQMKEHKRHKDKQKHQD